MIGELITRALLFVVMLPINIVLALRFSAIFTFAGFLLGLLGGLIAGYFVFIYTEPSDYKKPKFIDIADDSRQLTDEERKRFYRILPPWVHSPDVERINWLNKMMDLMWPYIDKAVAAEVLQQVTPIIHDNKPSFIDSIEFENLTLGLLPPAVIGIKSFQTMEDEVIIQPELRWVARPNVKVVVKVFGMKLSAHLTHLHIQAPARITLKPLSNYFPCFSKIVVSLMSSPDVDIGLSILGLDFLALPAVNRIVSAQVENAVGDLLLWPIAMTIYDEDPLPVKGKLYIKNIYAKNLRNVVGLVGTIDPFVRFGFGRKVGNFQTKEEKNKTDPSWVLEGVVNVHDKETEILKVEVFHRKKPKNILIGVCEVSLFDLADDKPTPFQRLPLLPDLKTSGSKSISSTSIGKSTREAGEISFELTYKPRAEQAEVDENAEEEVVIPNEVPVGGGLLWIKLRSARDLETKKSGYPNHFVVLKFRGQEQKSAKYKESNIEIFDDVPFTWACEKPPEKEMLHIKVIGEAKGASLATVTNPMALKRLLHTQEQVGHVDIPLRDVVTNGRTLDDYSLVGSKGSALKVEVKWAPKTAADVTVVNPGT